ncbi:MAG: hypothetical protein MUF09_11000 [Candidatus Nanopelagicales bacterium]|nr:hypothetical protein [Candidatus Nanopelagicales bacterium]
MSGARLPFGGITGNRLPVWAPVTDLALVGHLSDCSAPFDLVRVEAGTTVYLSASGLLLAAGAAGISLPDLDPCEPWFLRIGQVEGGYSATVWQATDPEPAEPQLTDLPPSGTSRLAIETFGFSPTPARELMIDWLDVTLEGAT